MQRHPSTAGRTPSFLGRVPFGTQLASTLSAHLNFYRVHLLGFLIVPLVASGVFYASNGENHIAYIDCLFMTVSAITVTGLNSILVADLTTWQQFILFIMMCLGSTSSVSMITILIRRHFFRRKFDYIIATSASARDRVNRVGAAEEDFSVGPEHTFEPAKKEKEREEKRGKPKRPFKVRADMIRRVDVPVKVNQMNAAGWLEKPREEAEESKAAATTPSNVRSTGADSSLPPNLTAQAGAPGEASLQRNIQIDESSKPDRSVGRRRSIDVQNVDTSVTASDQGPLDPDRIEQGVQQRTSTAIKHFPRSRTVEFHDEPKNDLRLRRQRTAPHDLENSTPARRGSMSTMRFDRTLTRTGSYHNDYPPQTAMHTGFGGFPNPLLAVAGYARKRLPSAVERQFTMPASTMTMRTTTMASVDSTLRRRDALDGDRSSTKDISYLTFDALVGRNSKFHGLTSAQQEELGGVEYRALTALIRIVAGYWLLSQLFAVTIVAPYMTYVKRYQVDFHNPVEVNQSFFSFFQVWSAFSNCGLSLNDASMVPFRDAVPVVLVMGLLILGGNTAFPIFWTLSKVVPKQSRVCETLQFLLDHPRRCFIYLFPSHQTWFLVFALAVLNAIDWVSFLVLDIGESEISSIPVGTRILDGLFQAIAVRTAGFSTVAIANVAPAVQLLYVIMMYIAAYPLALSIRSTNVYEERSIGVFEEGDDEAEAEARFEENKNASATGYMMYHARKQLTFDMWWLVLAVWLLCIIEKHNISDPNSPWISIFSLLFEVSSAYGTVRLSLGTPTKNTSLAGTLRTLSKLVLCAVMIRGRHRGLPIAIDRAVLLPSDLEKHGDNPVLRTDSFARKRPSFGSSSGVKPAMAEEREGLAEEPTFVATPDRRLLEEPEEMSSVSSQEELDRNKNGV